MANVADTNTIGSSGGKLPKSIKPVTTTTETPAQNSTPSPKLPKLPKLDTATQELNTTGQVSAETQRQWARPTTPKVTPGQSKLQEFISAANKQVSDPLGSMRNTVQKTIQDISLGQQAAKALEQKRVHAGEVLGDYSQISVGDLYNSATAKTTQNTPYYFNRSQAAWDARHNLQIMYRDEVEPAWSMYQQALEGYKAGNISYEDYTFAKLNYQAIYNQYKPLHDAYTKMWETNNSAYWSGADLDQMASTVDYWDAALTAGEENLKRTQEQLEQAEAKFRETQTMDDYLAYTELLGQYRAQAAYLGDMGEVYSEGYRTYTRRYLAAHPDIIRWQNVGAQYDQEGNVTGVDVTVTDILDTLSDLHKQRGQAKNPDAVKKLDDDIRFYSRLLNTDFAYANLTPEELDTETQDLDNRIRELSRTLYDSEEVQYYVRRGMTEVADALVDTSEITQLQALRNDLQTRRYEIIMDGAVDDLPKSIRDLADNYVSTRIRSEMTYDSDTPLGLPEAEIESLSELQKALRENGVGEDEARSIVKYLQIQADNVRVDQLKQAFTDAALLGVRPSQEAGEFKNTLNFGLNVLTAFGAGIGAAYGPVDTLLQKVDGFIGGKNPYTDAYDPINFNSPEHWGHAVLTAISEGDQKRQYIQNVMSWGNRETATAAADQRFQVLLQDPQFAQLPDSDKNDTYDQIFFEEMEKTGDTQKIAERITQVGSFMFGVAQSMAQSTAVACLTTLIGPGAIAVLSMSAAESTMQEMHEQGFNDAACIVGGAISGWAEYITEKYSIESILNIWDTSKLAGMTGQEFWSQLGINLGKQMIAEGSEEGASDLINLLADQTFVALLNGGMSTMQMNATRAMRDNPSLTWEEAMAAEWKSWAGELAQDVLAGAVSGAFMGGLETLPAYAAGTHQRAANGASLLGQGYNSLALQVAAQQAMETIEGQAALLDTELSTNNKRNTGRLLNAWLDTNAYEAMKKRFVELTGSEEGITPELLRATRAIANDQHLTPSQRQAIQNNSHVYEVANELRAYQEALQGTRDKDGYIHPEALDENMQNSWMRQADEARARAEYLWTETSLPGEQYVRSLQETWEEAQAANPGAKVMTPIAEDLKTAGLEDSKKATQQAELLGRVLDGEVLKSKDLRALDLNNSAVRKVFIDRSGLTGMPEGDISFALKSTYANRVASDAQIIKARQREIASSSAQLSQAQQEASESRMKAMAEANKKAPKNGIGRIMAALAGEKSAENKARREAAAKLSYEEQAAVTARTRNIETEGRSEMDVLRQVRQQSGQSIDSYSAVEHAFRTAMGIKGEMTKEQRAVLDGAYDRYLQSKGLTAAERRALKTAANATASERLSTGYRGPVIPRGTVVLDENIDREKLSDIQKASISVLEKLAAALGLRIHLYQSQNVMGQWIYQSENGAIITDNGFFYGGDGSIHIDINAGANGEQVILRTAAHELTHFIKKYSPRKFKVLRDFLMEQYEKKGLSAEELINKQLEKAKSEGRTISEAVAEEEWVADSMETMLTDGDIVARLESLKKKDRTLWQTIVGKLREIFTSVQNLYKGLDPQSEEGKIVQEMTDAFDEIQKLWLEGLTRASENYAKIDARVSEETKAELAEVGCTVKDGVVVADDLAELMDKEGYEKPVDPIEQAEEDLKHSPRYIPEWKESYMSQEGADADVAAQVEAFAKDVIGNDAIADLVPNGEYDPAVIKGNAQVGYGPIRTNQEYRWTFDMDTSCPRTFQFLDARNTLQRIAHRPLTDAESNNLMFLMRRLGQMIPCTYCYVENKRVQKSMSYLNYFKARNGVMNAKSDKEALSKMYSYDAKKGTISKAAQPIFDEWRQAVRDGTAVNPTAEECWEGWSTAKNSVFNWLDNQLSSKEFEYGPGVKNPMSESDMVALVCKEFGVTEKNAVAEISDFVRTWRRDTLAEVPHIYDTMNDEDVLDVNQDYLTLNRLACNYAKSASSAKTVEDYVPYVDQLHSISEEDKAFVMAMGGIRIHSSNDFRIDYVVDYIQFFADLAAGGWTSHLYTKSTEFCRIFGRTGARINLSIAMNTVNGNIVQNAQEGAVWKEARELRENYDNIGVMCMATDNAQLSFALNADWIDMIIPFHASGLPTAVWKNIRAWTNYTGSQNERPLGKDDMITLLQEKGIKVDKKATASEVKSLFYETFKGPIVIDGTTYAGPVLYDAKGKQKAPHFYPEDSVVDGPNGEKQLIPGHHNDVKRYLELCKMYGVKPRFAGVKVSDANGNIIDVTEHPGYLKLIKETARTGKTPLDTNFKQHAVEFNFNQKDDYLGMTPLEYALKKLAEQANLPESAGMSAANKEAGVIKLFQELYLGKDRAIGWMPSRDDKSPAARQLWRNIDARANAYEEMYPADVRVLSKEQREHEDVLMHSARGVRAKDADLQQLSRAEQMEKAGENWNNIRKETGWYRGMDGMWRYEIDDSAAEYFPDGTARFSQEHPEYAEYQDLSERFTLEDEELDRLFALRDKLTPELDRLKRQVSKGEATLDMLLKHDALFKSYPELRNTRVVFQNMAAGEKAYYDPSKNLIALSRKIKTDPMDSLIHEIQHAIQGIEGFSAGTSSEYFSDRGYSGKDSKRNYWTAPGEIEARDAASRRKLTAEQRRETPPDVGGLRHSVRQIVGPSGADYGTGVFMDSYLLENLTEDERVEMFREYLNEIAGQIFPATGKNNTPTTVKVAEAGRRFTDHNGKSRHVNADLREKFRKNHTKQEAVALIDEVLQTAKFEREDPARYPHDWLDDQGKNPWQGWKTYMQDASGNVYSVILHIATADDGQLYLYDITPKEIESAGQFGISNTSPGGSGGQPGISGTSPSDNKIPQNEESVKSSARVYPWADVSMGLNFRDPSGVLLSRVFSGEKKYETRSATDSLSGGRLPKAYLNKTMGIIRTGNGPAELVGFWELGDGELRDSAWLEEHKAELGNDGTQYEAQPGEKKWVYPIKWAEPTTPVGVSSRGIQARNISEVTKTIAESNKYIIDQLKDRTFSDPEIGEEVRFSVRERQDTFNPLRNPDGSVKLVYKAFYAYDGKLYPPMISNLSDEEQKAIKNAASGTLSGLDTPVGVVLDAEVGRLARYKTDASEYDVLFRTLWSGSSKIIKKIKAEMSEEGYNIKNGLTAETRPVAEAKMERDFPQLRNASKEKIVEHAGDLIRNDTGRLAVVNDKGGGTLAFRPGWHLGEWPNLRQFDVNDPVTGEKRSVMPDSLVFCACEIAGDVDYQLDAMELGMTATGGFDRTQAGLPYIPVDGYYKYRTNADPTTAPWYITGAIKVVAILDDADCRRICAQYGVTPQPRVSHKDINLTDYKLKRGPVTALSAEELQAYKKSTAAIQNEEALKEALADARYKDAYVPRKIDFNNKEILKEFGRNSQDPNYYRALYEARDSEDVLRSARNAQTAEEAVAELEKVLGKGQVKNLQKTVQKLQDSLKRSQEDLAYERSRAKLERKEFARKLADAKKLSKTQSKLIGSLERKATNELNRTRRELQRKIDAFERENLRLEQQKKDLNTDMEWKVKMAQSDGEQKLKAAQRMYKEKIRYNAKTDRQWANGLRQSAANNARQEGKRRTREAVSLERKVLSLPATAAASAKNNYNRRLANREQKILMNEGTAVCTPLPFANEKDRLLPRNAAEFAQRVRDTWSKGYRAMVNSTMELDRMAKLQTRTDNLSVWVNVLRASKSTPEMMYTIGLLDRQGNLKGASMEDVFLCHDPNGVFNETMQNALNDYMFHMHNIDRMSQVSRAIDRVNEHLAKYPFLAEMSSRELRRWAAEGEPSVTEYVRLMKLANAAKDKAVLPDADNYAVTADASRAVVATYEKEMPWLKDKAAGIYEWWDIFMREWAVGSSISAADYEAMHEMYPHYVPTYRKDKGAHAGNVKYQTNSISSGEVVKKATGSVAELERMEDQFVRSLTNIVRNSRQNDLLRTMIEEFLFDDAGEFSDYGVFDWESDEATRQNFWEFETEHDNETMQKLSLNGGTGYRVSCWVDGVKMSAFVNQAMFEGLTVLFNKNTVGKVIGKVGHTLTAPMKGMITGYNPTFALKNIARDLHTALTNSRFGPAYLKYWGRALAEIRNNTDHWLNFQALGGAQAGMTRMEGGFAKAMQPKTGVKKAWGNTLGTIGYLGELSESVSRFAEYLGTIDLQGDTYENRLQGIRNAAEVTVDFGRSGSVGHVINQWVPYWNPNVQGLDKMIRNIAEQPDIKSAMRRLGRAGLVNLIPAALQAAIIGALGRWKDYEELSAQQKDNYYCIPLIGKEHGFIKIPKSQDWAAFISTPFIRIMEGVTSADDRNEGWWESIGDSMSGWWESALMPNMPFDMRDIGLGNKVPVIAPIFVDDILDLMSNKNWAGSAIVPYNLQKTSAKEQFDADTSLFAYYFGQIFKTSPMALDYIINNYMGNFWGVLAKAIPGSPLSPRGYYTGESSIGDKLLDAKSTILSPFFSDNRYSNSTMSEYYTLLSQLEQEVTDAGSHGDKKTAEHYALYAALTQSGGYVDQIRDLMSQARNLARGDEQATLRWAAIGLADEALDFANKVVSGEIKDPELWMTYNKYGDTIMSEAESLKKYEDDFNFSGKLAQPQVLWDRSGALDVRYELDADTQRVYNAIRTEAYRDTLTTVINSSAYQSEKTPEGRAARLAEAKRLALSNAESQMLQYLRDNRITGETIGKVDYSAEMREAAYSVSWILGETNAYKPELTDEFVRLYDFNNLYSFIPSDAVKKTFRDQNDDTQVYTLTEQQQQKYSTLYHDTVTDYMSKVISSSEYRQASDEERAAMLARARTYATNDTATLFNQWLHQTGANPATRETASEVINLEAKYAVQRSLGDVYAMDQGITDELIRLYEYKDYWSDLADLAYLPIDRAPTSYVSDDKDYRWVLNEDQREVYMGMMFDIYQHDLQLVMASSAYRRADDEHKALLICATRDRLDDQTQAAFKEWLIDTHAPLTAKKSPEQLATDEDVSNAMLAVDGIIGEPRSVKAFRQVFGQGSDRYDEIVQAGETVDQILNTRVR